MLSFAAYRIGQEWREYLVLRNGLRWMLTGALLLEADVPSEGGSFGFIRSVWQLVSGAGHGGPLAR